MFYQTQHQKKTSADKTAIGFDYQFLYFVLLLLRLKPSQRIGYEVKDDIHIELEEKEIYIQLKHSMKLDSENNTKNLTDLDMDLWKTIFNWTMIINEIDISMQNEFLNKIEFMLVTNKNNNKNKVYENINNFQTEKLNIDEFQDFLKQLCEKTKSAEIKKYILKSLSIEKDVLGKFLNSIVIVFDEDQIIEKLEKEILSKYVDERKVGDVLKSIIGEFKVWHYDSVKKNEKRILTFEDINQRVKKFFIEGRSTNFPRTNFVANNLPEKLESQKFIQELLEMGDVTTYDTNVILMLTRQRLTIENRLEEWVQNNFITESEREILKEVSKNRWVNIHRKSHRSSITNSKPENLNNNAFACLDKIREQTLQIVQEDLNLEEANGYYYSLSEKGVLGWKYEWREHY